MLGKAAAAALVKLYGTEDVPLLKINGPEIQTAYIGDTEQIIRDIFAYARAFFRRTKRRLVIFIDEADAILPTRDGSGGRRVHAWEESQVATFLTEMDGIEESGAFVILATNRPHAIDAALLRDGRCDRKIKVLRPDRAAAEKILTNAFKNVPATGDMATGTGTMASKAADAFFDPSRRLGTIIHSNGIEHLTLGHIVNGAMLNGLVEQAKAVAFRRDLAAGTRSGLCFADVESAIVSILEQNRRLNHFAAVEDLVETLGLTLTDAEPRKKSHALH
ncbi:MAG: ATP-binding protein [Bradyrhizobium sp.]|nr:ATP-binding protein [Bradyrhizobium sp.]